MPQPLLGRLTPRRLLAALVLPVLLLTGCADEPGEAAPSTSDVVTSDVNDVEVTGEPGEKAPKGQPRFKLGPAVDAGDTLSTGEAFRDVDEFKRLVLTRPEPVVQQLPDHAVHRLAPRAGREGQRHAVAQDRGGHRLDIFQGAPFC